MSIYDKVRITKGIFKDQLGKMCQENDSGNSYLIQTEYGVNLTLARNEFKYLPEHEKETFDPHIFMGDSS